MPYSQNVTFLRLFMVLGGTTPIWTKSNQNLVNFEVCPLRTGGVNAQAKIAVKSCAPLMSTETITPTPTNDNILRGQDNSENGYQLALESVSRGVWHCVLQHFENAAQRSAKLPGRPILRPVGGHFSIYLGVGVSGH